MKPWVVALASLSLAGCDCSGSKGGVDAGDAGRTADAGHGDGGSSGTDGGNPSAGASVLEYHGNAAHDGHYIVPGLTRAAAGALHLDPSWDGGIDGTAMNNAQPLFWDSRGAGADLVIAATDSNQVSALRATDGTAQWQVTLANPVPLNGGGLGCGNIDPLGITGTPVIDPATRTLYLDAMTPGPAHQLYALSIDDGGTRPGFPIALETALAAANFQSAYQGERGALTIQGGVLYVPYGGYYGDCGSYHGIVAGFPLANPSAVTAWSTGANEGGIWSVGGVFSDGASVYAATGNTAGSSQWVGGESVLRFSVGSNLGNGPADYYFPHNWQFLDQFDIDLGGATPALIDVPGTPPGHYVMPLGKDGVAYLLNRDNLGSFGLADGGGEMASLQITTSDRVGGGIFGSATTYTTPSGTYVVARANAGGTLCPTGQSGNLIGLRVTNASPYLTVVWCRDSGGAGSPIVTTTDALGSNAIVWIVGAEGDNQLHGFDGNDGSTVYPDGGAADQLGKVDHFSTILVAKGRLFVGGEGRVYAFTP